MKKYNIIYADPPWSYDNKSMKYSADDETNIAADQQYNLMTLEDLKAMPIKNITEKNAVLFMWCVNPLMPEAFELMKAWGFKYKTMLTWKKSSGTGYWFRGVTEHILFGVRGDVAAFRSGKDNFYECRSGKHSQKPHFFRTLIADVTKTAFEEPKRLELFARSREGLFPDFEYEGWDVYGNQVNNSICLETVGSSCSPTDILEYIEAQDKECFKPFQAAYFILMFLLQVAIKDDGLKSQLQEAMDLLMNGYLPERIKQYEKVKQMLNKLLNNIKDEHTNTTNSQIAAGARKCKRAL